MPVLEVNVSYGLTTKRPAPRSIATHGLMWHGNRHCWEESMSSGNSRIIIIVLLILILLVVAGVITIR